ncbi:AbfB domain-containing protein [Catenuloplanes indicus]|uniref:DNA-directed RNA polymerase specialized sigma24 family protein n=1 Tax=Catenuloplanes indicus TaxID=137267 RepID=A0AAE3VWU7_9ACTN|nr:AbfB domain-containing protein [Catenuloplanes indicus]MDQ0365468.1 DNA-directed RNA polymerase specialized sigma24 family protein [Catenuloplanes indicus]
MTQRFALVLAARRGDRPALAELVAEHLPLVYNVIGRAVGAHADIDDAVRQTMHRVVRELPDLREPAAFRPWLLAHALRQATRVRRGGTRLPLPEDGDAPDPGADFVGLSIIRLGLSGQRRRLAEATRWLDGEHATTLSLWWLESAGTISRTESAAALRLSLADAGARIDRMRDQLGVTRALVSALRARPVCPGLRLVTTDWDHRPGPAWRRRIVRHVDNCPVCSGLAAHHIPAERLVSGLALVPVPNTLLAALHADGLLPEPAATTPVVSRGTVYEPLELLAAPAGDTLEPLPPVRRPSAVLVLAAVAVLVVLVAGGALALTRAPDVPDTVPVAADLPRRTRQPSPSDSGTPSAPVTPSPSGSASASPSPSLSPSPSPSRPAAGVAQAAAPAPSAKPVPSAKPEPSVPGRPVEPAPADDRRSIRSVNYPDRYVRERGGYAMLDPVGASGATAFTVVPGLADARCLSLRLPDGRYLRHYDFRLRASQPDGGALFRADATFCPQAGAVSGSVTLRSYNYPGHVVRHRDFALYIDRPDGSRDFARDASFVLG